MTVSAFRTLLVQPSLRGVLPDLVWAPAQPTDNVDYSLDFTPWMADDGDAIIQAFVSARPSGSGELALADLSVAANVLTVQMSGGVPGRAYDVQAVVLTATGRTQGVIAHLAIARESALGPIPPAPSLSFGPVLMWSSAVTITSTTVSLVANEDTVLLAANPARLRAWFTTLPGGDVNLNFGAAAVVDEGWPLPSPTADQKAGRPFDTQSTQDIHGISSEAATVVVLEEV